MHGRIYPKDQVRVAMIASALVPVLAIALGCGASQPDFSEGENTSGPSASTALAPSTRQAPPRDNQAQAPPERYEDLRTGEIAEFKNGLTVTLEGASIMEVPESLSDRLRANDLLIAVRFSVENTNPQGRMPRRSFRITSAQWEALDESSNPLQTLYLSETSMVAGEPPNPSPDYPYTGWQGELGPEQRRQGSMLFAASPSTKTRVRFTQPVMNPPLAEWDLGTVSALPRAP